MNSTPKKLALAISFIGLPMVAWAADEVQLPTVEVQGTRAENQSAFLHHKTEAAEIRQRNAVNLKAAVNDIPGVEVPNYQGSRSGNDSVNIRGLGGNRVSMTVDGIELPEAQETKFFATSGTVFGRGAFVDPVSISSVAVNKNAGAYSVAGAMGIRTVSAEDVLGGQPYGGWLETAYNSVDHSIMTSGSAAASAGAWQGMVLGAYRHGSETDNQGTVGGTGALRTQANPQSYNSRYFLTSHDFQINDNHSANVTAEYLKRNSWLDNLSGLGVDSRRVETRSDQAKDVNKRTRISVAHHYENDAGWLNNVDTQLYWQKSTTDNARYRSTVSRGATSNRIDLAETTDQVWGANVTAGSRLSGDKVTQNWRYGIQFAHHAFENNLDSTYSSLARFSNGKQIRANVFAESDIHSGSLIVSPGLALSYYKYTPTPSSDYQQGAQSVSPIQGQHETFVSPKLGIAWQVNPLLVPFVSYSRGFKAPSGQQLISSFSNTGRGYGYAIVGNPNLKPETANNFEYGVKGGNATLSYQVNGFYNRHRNFIDYVNLGNGVPGYSTFVYQYHNVDKATIQGLEMAAQWQFAPDWRVNGALAYAHGTIESDSSKTPLNSVNPLKIKVGVAYDKETWGANVNLTYVSGKKDRDLDVSPQAWTVNPSKSYALVDLGAYWKPSKHLSLSANINNLFDKKYWNWADLSTLAFQSNRATTNYDGMLGTRDVITPTTADRYTAPGRNFNIGLRYTF